MRKKNIVLSLIVLLVLSINSVYALEVSEGWTEYDIGKTTIDIDKLKVFEDKLATRVNELNRLNLDRVYRYSIDVADSKDLDNYMEVSNDKYFEKNEDALEWAANNKPEKSGWKFLENIINIFRLDKVLELIRFESKEEVVKAKEEFESSVDEESSNVVVTEIRDESDDVTVTVDNNQKFDNFEDAYKASLELVENTHDYVVTVRVVEENPEYVETESLSLDTTVFDCREEAIKYITSLEESGYTVSYDIEEVNELSILDKRFEELASAEEALEEFLNLYPKTVISNIEEIRDEMGDTTEFIDNDYKFESVEEAMEMADSLRENTHYYIVSVNVIDGTPEYVETTQEEFTLAFATESEAIDYITSLEEAGYTVSYDIEEVNELSTLDKIFEELVSAEEALEEFLNLYPETVISNIEEIRDEMGDKTVSVENTSKYYSFDGASAAAEELRVNNHDYIVDVTVVVGNPELVESKNLTLNIVFDSYDEALDYIANLENDGYTVVANIEEVTEVVSLNQVYDTYNDANNALEVFKNELKELSLSNIEEVRDNTEDTTIINTGTTSYETREEAEEVAISLNEKNDNYEVVATVREGSKTVTVGPTDIESEQFDSREEAEAYIASLEALGYDVSNLKIDLVPFSESIWGDEDNVIVNPGTGSSTSFTYGHFDVTLLTQFTKIDALGNKTTVTGVVTVSSVKINNKSVAMEGPSIDQNTGLTEYTSEERRDLKVTNNSLVEVIGTVKYYTDDKQTILSDALPFAINGYLTESQNVCGGKLGRDKGFDLEFESITIVNNKVVIDTNVVSKYKVTGTITKTEQQSIYYVDTAKTTYGYDYKVMAEGIKLVGYSVDGNAVKNTYRDVYLLDINKTIKDYDYHVYAEGIKFINYLLNGIKAMDIYKDIYLLNIIKTTIDYDYKVKADGIKLIGYKTIGNASRDIYKDVYTLNIEKTIKDYDYEVSGVGIKTYYDVISKYVRLIDVNYLVEYMELGKGGDIEVLPPQTGVNSYSRLYNVISLLVMGIILVIKKFI